MAQGGARIDGNGRPAAAPAALHVMAALVGIAVPLVAMGRAAMAVALVLALLCVLFLPRRGACVEALARQAGSPAGILVGVLFVLWLPGVVFSLDPLRSFMVWARMIFFVAGVTVLWAALTGDGRARGTGLRALLVATAVVVGMALVALFVTPELLSLVRGKGWHAINPVLGLKGFASGAMLLVPVVLWSGYRLGGAWIPCAIAESVGLVAIIADTISRSATAGLVAMAIVAGVMVAFARRERKVTALVALTLCAITIALLAWLYTHPMSPPGATAPLPLPLWLVDFHRQSIWRFTFGLAMQSPWIGHGINMINYVPGSFDRIPGYGYIYIPAHPHDWMLEVLSETGVVGLAPLLVLVAAMLRRLARDYVASRDPAVLAATAVAVGYWVAGMFNFSFWSAWWQVSFMILVALCLSQRQRPGIEAAAPGQPAPD